MSVNTLYPADLLASSRPALQLPHPVLNNSFQPEYKGSPMLLSRPTECLEADSEKLKTQDVLFSRSLAMTKATMKEPFDDSLNGENCKFKKSSFWVGSPPSTTSAEEDSEMCGADFSAIMADRWRSHCQTLTNVDNLDISGGALSEQA